jgi:hypothetical protein
MATGTRKQARSLAEDVGGQVGQTVEEVGRHAGRTLEASLTQRPSWPELAWDAMLVGATLAEAVSPPAAIAGAALNRLIHTAR